MANFHPSTRRPSLGPEHADEEYNRRSSGRPYPTRGSSSGLGSSRLSEAAAQDPPVPRSPSKRSMSPTKDRPQKHVTFQHILPDPRQCARLPMRVMISPHDTTESIIATVKNFYGLYGPGVAFQDRHGNMLIAAYDNFDNDMTIFVKETLVEPKPEIPLMSGETTADASRASSEKPRLGAPFEMRPPATNRLTLQTDGIDVRPRSRMQAGTGDGEQNDGTDSDGDASVTSSRRSKADAHVSAEISVDNIVEGGRRKRAKFESFELPLFVPPQVSAGSMSSISPQRRAPGFDGIASPLHYANTKTLVYGQPIPSPQSFGRYDGAHATNGFAYGNYGQMPQQQQQQQQMQYPGQSQQRGRAVFNYAGPRQSTGGILPTPEPTVGSVISDEDVALQLMRLGDSVSHGRTSTSTADDGFSRQADVSSGEEIDTRRKVRHDFKAPRTSAELDRRRSSGRLSDSMLVGPDVYSSDPEYGFVDAREDKSKTASRKSSKSKNGHRGSTGGSATASATESNKTAKHSHTSSKIKTKAINGPMSPTSLDSQSRRMSTASSHGMLLGEDEEDLSTKPRCQRCRKSKKGCDREQPVCGRCKDAGVGPEGCIPEDEVSGRKGRYGRPMGVAVKKTTTAQHGPGAGAISGSAPKVAPIDTSGSHMQGEFLTPALPTGDKSKKRKR